jgi:isoleucyl-tRNA synthetase
MSLNFGPRYLCLQGRTSSTGTSLASREAVCIVLGFICVVRRQRSCSSQRSAEVSDRTIVCAKKKEKAQGESVEGPYKNTVLLPRTDFSQRANAKTREVELQTFWKSERIYEQLQEAPDPRGTFSLHDGPPYANGSLHMGHALNKMLKDFINKYKAVNGHRVKYIPGWDCHGLPIELKVLQSMKSSETKQLSPLELRRKATEYAWEAVKEQRSSFERYGVWGDFEKPYLTFLPEYEAAQLGVFEEMVRGGHIYRSRKPVYWSPCTKTALAEAELEYPEGHVSPSIYVAFKCVGEIPETFGDSKDLEVAIWTTTPWTIPANRAVAVNPALDYVIARIEASEERPSRRVVVAKALVEELSRLFGSSLTVEAEFLGGILEGLHYEHPLTGVVNPVVLGGDYITTESGTGLVHTSPGHGPDDYKVGLRYKLEVASPVDDCGNFTEEVGIESLVGANVLKDANDKVIELLERNGRLLLRKPYLHKYPYDWRSKTPVITRATPQWFASIDSLRDAALHATNNVKFVPATGSNRMRPMIEGRSDWCISRQRSWGVPIPAFYRKDNGDALLTPEVIAHVRRLVQERGSDVWWELPVADLLPKEYLADADLYTKGTDTMDVWFDSGSSWAAVRDRLGSPVDLYLEGQDQFRGWFQSSLITSVAVNGRAPYKSVMTHGFCVDGEGKKMSKSIGNVIDPRTIIEGGKDPKKEPALGADVLRLWVASVDFTFDVPISQEILASVGETVKKIRNRARFMLGNIHDFNPASDAVSYDELPLIDRYIISRAEDVFAQITEAYESYAFSRATRTMFEFLQQELSNVYFDLAKDRLYVAGASHLVRRSCQTVLRWLLVNLARIMAPVLSHLAEDIWQFLPGKDKAKSVFLTGWWTPFPGRPQEADPLVCDMTRILALRGPVNQALEAARRSDGPTAIGLSLEASVEILLRKDSDLHRAFERVVARSQNQWMEADSLHKLLLVSEAVIKTCSDERLLALEATPDSVTISDEELEAVVTVRRAEGSKCGRCFAFTHSASALCSRCSLVLEQLQTYQNVQQPQ